MKTRLKVLIDTRETNLDKIEQMHGVWKTHKKIFLSPTTVSLSLMVFWCFFSFKNKISVNDCHKFVISFINIFCFCGFQAKLTNQCCWSLSRQQFFNYWFNRSLLWFHQLLNMNVTAVDSIDNIVSNSLQNVKDFLWSIVRFILEWL